ncbi:MAG TPA: trypsin-like serine protease [Methylocella sp.]|nr:trypsin-like serine protease [Methylocella sp.]
MRKIATSIISVSVLSVFGSGAAHAQQAVIKGPVVSVEVPYEAPGKGIDFARAKPMPLPQTALPDVSPEEAIRSAPAAGVFPGKPGFSPGGAGDGKKSPVMLPVPQQSLRDAPNKQNDTPQEFGSFGVPYTTSQVTAFQDDTVAHYPFRAAGKLFFKNGAASFVCSASLIKPGVVVTAAHCVADFGKKKLYSAWQFVPAYANGAAPYGVWTVRKALVPLAYFNGTDVCSQKGVVCQNDVAVLVLNPQNGRFAGTSTGWFGYEWNNYSFTSKGQVQITALGYPTALDNGRLMERTDSQGTRTPSYANCTLIGSLMSGGSSGGPWLANLGLAPTLTGAKFGSAAKHNAVVGVTSFGNDTVKRQGASPFTTGNIVALVNQACTDAVRPCQ